MDKSLQNDKHKELKQQTQKISTALNTIEKEGNDLPMDMSDTLFDLTHRFKAPLKQLNQLAEKSGLFDKDKALDAALLQVKNQQAALREFLRTTYSALISDTTAITRTEIHDTKETTQQPRHDTVQHNLPNVSADTVKKAPVQEPLVVIPAPLTEGGASNPEVLNSIQQERRQMETSINSIHQALKKNQWATIGAQAKNISRSALKIEDLVLLTKDEQRQNIRTIAGGIESYASQLYNLSRKGKAAHDQIHEVLETIEVKFSSLSTGISILK